MAESVLGFGAQPRAHRMAASAPALMQPAFGIHLNDEPPQTEGAIGAAHHGRRGRRRRRAWVHMWLFEVGDGTGLFTESRHAALAVA